MSNIIKIYDIVNHLYPSTDNKTMDTWFNNNKTAFEESHILEDAGLIVENIYSRFAILRGAGTSYYVISKSKNIRENLDFILKRKSNILDERYLKGFGNIGDLYLYKVGKALEYPTQQNLLIIEKELADYDFIVDFIQQKIQHSVNYEAIINFVNKNKQVLNKIRRHFTKAPEELGSGSYGTAYSIGSGKILKIFMDEFGFKKSIEAMESGRDVEAHIFEVGEIGGFQNYTLYYYIMEKMKPISGINAKIDIGELIERMSKELSRDEVLGFLKFMKDHNMSEVNAHEISNSKDIRYNDKLKLFFDKLAVINNKKYRAIHLIDDLRKEILEFISEHEDFFEKIRARMDPGIINRIIIIIKNKFYRKKYDAVKEALNLKEDWFIKYVEEIVIKVLTKRLDLYIRNLGVTSEGYLKYYDSAADCFYDESVSEVIE